MQLYAGSWRSGRLICFLAFWSIQMRAYKLGITLPPSIAARVDEVIE